jgi:hypothetical protein
MSLLNEVIESLSTGTYSVTRVLQGTYTQGRYTAGATTTFEISACEQPVEGRKLQPQAEGEHADEIRVLYTNTELRTRTPQVEPDVITIDGEAFEVFRCEKWKGLGQTQYRVHASRVVIP